MILIEEAESAALVSEGLALAAAREAFLAMGSGTTFPVVHAHGSDPADRFTVKSACAPELAGLKVGSYWPGNDRLHLPRHSSVVILLDGATGRVGAIIETAVANAFRTAAADALAVDVLARPESGTLAIFGTGHQAYYEVRAVARVRAVDRVLVVGRSSQAANAMADRLRREMDIEAEATDGRRACLNADIIVTATTSTQPLFESDWIQPGTHISAMGADAKGKQELPSDLLRRASVFCDLPDQSRAIGELQHCQADVSAVPLGLVLAGTAAARSTPDEITVFDSSGTAIQDLTLAAALIRARDGDRDAHEVARNLTAPDR